jgi:beta-propeller repeat-containing protein
MQPLGWIWHLHEGLYSSDGQELWQARYEGPYGGEDYLTGLALDPSGSAYVTGWSQGAIAAVKYSPDGREVWSARHRGLKSIRSARLRPSLWTRGGTCTWPAPLEGTGPTTTW